MRSVLLALAFTAAATGAASAQAFSGNWECQAAGAAAGLLTIYGSSYIYTSPIFQDPLSGAGNVTGYSDGVTFADGPLVTQLGLVAGRLIDPDPASGRPQMQLETQTAAILLCKGM